jgi:hypothetical protein
VSQPGCAEPGYTSCASGDYQSPDGTSFSAPQVSAAAAVLLGLYPSLTNSQVSRLLERHTDDVNASSGCDQCPAGRDKYSGWGSLDVTKTVDFLGSGNPLPPADRYEPNDSAPQAQPLWGSRADFGATLDFWDDPVDVYRVKLAAGQRLRMRVAAGWSNADVNLTLWRPGTTSLHGRSGLVAHTAHPGATQHLPYRAARGGWYVVELRIKRHGQGRYTLKLTKS